jgi:hypothetical protein
MLRRSMWPERRAPKREQLCRKAREPQKTLFYRIVSRALPDFLDANPFLPQFIRMRFYRFLECGRPEFGCFVFRCGSCNQDSQLAFSCKQRELCPSCSNKMMEVDAWEMDRLLPNVPFRHFAVNYPFEVSQKLAFQPDAIRDVEKTITNTLKRWMSARCGKAKTGGVIVRHRAGASLNLLIHTHFLIIDGGYKKEGNDLRFSKGPNLTQRDLNALTDRLRKRIEARLKKLGITGMKPSTSPAAAPHDEPQSGRTSRASGLHVFASQSLDRSTIYSTCKYLLRSHIEPKRIRMAADGTILYELDEPGPNGSLFLRFTNRQFLMALSSLLPRAGTPVSRYFGVLASGAPERKIILSPSWPTVLRDKPQPNPPRQGEPQQPGSETDTPKLNWHELLKRTYSVD